MTADSEKDRQTDMFTARDAHRKRDRQTDRQTDRKEIQSSGCLYSRTTTANAGLKLYMYSKFWLPSIPINAADPGLK